MARVMAFDYGLKRTGIAVTDPGGTIATALATVNTNELISFITTYLQNEMVEGFVIGMPVRMNTLDTHISDKVRLFGANLARKFIQIPVHFVDERFTSKIAVRSMIDSGVKKKDRRNKALIDQVSAVIILQSYMENKAFLKSRER